MLIKRSIFVFLLFIWAIAFDSTGIVEAKKKKKEVAPKRNT